MSLARECKDFWKYYFETSTEDKEICIYAENGEYFINFEGLLNELLANGRKVCYVTSSIDDPILDRKDENLRVFYQSTLLPLFMVLLNSRVCLMTLTDLHNFHIKRSVNQVHYVYVFHSLVSLHMVYREGSYDHYDAYLATGTYQLDEMKKIEELRSLEPKEMIKCGYYRLEKVYQEYESFNKSDEGNVVLLAPSWGDGNVLETCGSQLIALLLDNGYEVIVRPHPEAFKRAEDLMTSIEKEFKSHEKFFFEKSVATNDSILRADYLISDYSGIALEYAFGTERPVIFMDVPKKIRNAQYEQMQVEAVEVSLRDQLGKVVALDEIKNIPDALKEFELNKESYRNEIRKLRAKYVFNFNNSSEVGARYLIDYLDGDNKVNESQREAVIYN